MSEFVVPPEVDRVVSAFLSDLDCPRSLTVAILWRYGEWDQLLSLRADPFAYCDPDAYLRSVAATDLLRKCASLPSSVDLERATLDVWEETEKQCYLTNRRMRDLDESGPFGGRFDPRIGDFLRDCKMVMRNVIGAGPNLMDTRAIENSVVPFNGRFGPGATVSDSSQRCTPLDKMSSVPTLTSDAAPWMLDWISTAWCQSLTDSIGSCAPSFVRGSRFTMVPKTAVINRPINIEPSLNGFYQLAFGSQIRQRLRRQGIDLDGGQSIHTRVACAASLSGDFSTIDLSSASDTVAYELVKALLPPEWFAVLDSLRSPFTEVNGGWRRLEKFSSMGNGFTFELETAIFAVIAFVACGFTCQFGKEIFVYGDDIIVPTQHADDVIAALKFFGFTPNRSKTFVTGPFRESCGGDFYMGCSVRAHYLKEFPNEPHEWIALANGLRRVADQLGITAERVGRDRAVGRTAWFRCLDNIPKHVRDCRGPSELGDQVIYDDEQYWQISWKRDGVDRGIRWIRVWRPVKHRKVRLGRFNPSTLLSAALYGIVPERDHASEEVYARTGKHHLLTQGVLVEPYFDYIVPRDGVIGYSRGWVAFS